LIFTNLFKKLSSFKSFHHGKDLLALFRGMNQVEFEKSNQNFSILSIQKDENKFEQKRVETKRKFIENSQIYENYKKRKTKIKRKRPWKLVKVL
jgi:hypothetical protein